MKLDTEISQLKKQCNLFAWIVVISLLLLLAVATVYAVRNRNELKVNNDEIIRLQREIVSTQQLVTNAQAEVRKTQKEITEQLASHP